MEKNQIIIIGGSAGSVGVLMKILPKIPESYPIPIVVVVHRMAQEDNLLESLLKSKCSINIIEAEDKMHLAPSAVYMAPPDFHLLFEKDRTIALDYSEKVNYTRPSIDITMQSASDVYGNKVTGILLTGSNQDGAIGMKKIAENGGSTIIQSPESSEIKTMPESAEKLSKIDHVLNPDEILDYLMKTVLNR
ncbi:MAG: chemotaxis protein CheB [Bacteroidia bacterium]